MKIWCSVTWLQFISFFYPTTNKLQLVQMKTAEAAIQKQSPDWKIIKKRNNSIQSWFTVFSKQWPVPPHGLSVHQFSTLSNENCSRSYPETKCGQTYYNTTIMWSGIKIRRKEVFSFEFIAFLKPWHESAYRIYLKHLVSIFPYHTKTHDVGPFRAIDLNQHFLLRHFGQILKVNTLHAEIHIKCLNITTFLP